MLTWTKDGEDDVLKVNDRDYGSRDAEVMRIDGKTGAVTFKKEVVLEAGENPSLGAGAVGTTELEALAVTTAKIGNLAVTAGKLAADAVETDKIKDLNVTTGKLAASAVTTAKITDLNVTTAKLAAAAVTKAKAAVFVSAEQTATGSAQNVAHGLAAVPAAVLVVPTAGNNGSGAAGDKASTITEGAHDATNVIVTMTAGAKFKVLAWA